MAPALVLPFRPRALARASLDRAHAVKRRNSTGGTLEHVVRQDLALDVIHGHSGSQGTCHAPARAIDRICCRSASWLGGDGQDFPVGLSDTLILVARIRAGEAGRGPSAGAGGGPPPPTPPPHPPPPGGGA